MAIHGMRGSWLKYGFDAGRTAGPRRCPGPSGLGRGSRPRHFLRRSGNEPLKLPRAERRPAQYTIKATRCSPWPCAESGAAAAGGRRDGSIGGGVESSAEGKAVALPLTSDEVAEVADPTGDRPR
jgi:hypothetical protein